MDIVCARTTILNMVKFCSGQNVKHGTNVVARGDGRLVAQSVTLHATGTGMNAVCQVEKIYTSARGEAEVTRPGKVAVNSADLLLCLHNMPPGPIQVSLEDGIRIKAVGQSLAYHLLTETEGATSVPEPAGLEFSIPAATLRRLLRVFSAISDDDTRAHISSALFESLDDRVQMVATDGFRLHIATERVGQVFPRVRFLIPKPAVAALMRMSRSDTAMFHFDVPSRSVTVQQGVSIVSFVYPDLQYPPYENVVPERFSASFQLQAETFTEALRSVHVTTDDPVNGATMSLRHGILSLDSSRKGGCVHVELPVNYIGERHCTSFDVRYLLDALEQTTDSEVTVGMNGVLDPCVIEEPGYKAIIMPCRI